MTHVLNIDPRFSLSGFLIGLLVGQTGVGGGSLMTPLLVLVFGIHPATAVGTDLLYASATKGVGTVVHGLNHTVDWRIAKRLLAGSLPATVVTLLALSHVSSTSPSQARIMSVILGATLLVTALAILFRGRLVAAIGPKLDRLTQRQQQWLTVLTGLCLGALVTMSSVGAGALGATALVLLYPRAPMAVIVGTDIAHAVPLTLLAGIGHWYLGSVDGHMLVSLLSGSVPGIILGSWLAVRMPEIVLRPVLAATLVIAGLRIAF